MKIHKFLIFSMALAGGSIFLSSCEKDEDSKDLAKVQVIHASPDAPGVDVLIDDSKVNSSPLSFPNNTAYLDVEAGTRNLKVNAAGTTTTVINGNVTLEKNKYYSVFAADVLSSIEPVILVDDLTAPASGKAHVRFVHLSPDAPAVDVAVSGGPIVFSNVAFKGATGFTAVDAATYTFDVKVAGTNTVALSLPGIKLDAGKIYTVFAKGFLLPPAGNTNILGAQIIINK
jgi:Domain of unknown function (DUF4397)